MTSPKKATNISRSFFSSINLFSTMTMLVLSFSISVLNAKENETSEKPLISDLKIDVLGNRIYFRWLAKDVRHDGLFVLEAAKSGSYVPVSYKSAIGVPVSIPMLYCLTLGDSIDVSSNFRIKYMSIKGDSAFSVPVSANHWKKADSGKSKEPEYLRIKVLQDTLFDEAAIQFSDSAASIKKNFFEGETNPFVYFKSEENIPLCLQPVAPVSDKKVIPLYFKNSTGGLFTLVFKKAIVDKYLRTYIEDPSTKVLTPIENQDSITVYLKNASNGESPSFNLIIVNEKSSGGSGYNPGSRGRIYMRPLEYLPTSLLIYSSAN